MTDQMPYKGKNGFVLGNVKVFRLGHEALG